MSFRLPFVLRREYQAAIAAGLDCARDGYRLERALRDILTETDRREAGATSENLAETIARIRDIAAASMRDPAGNRAATQPRTPGSGS